MSANDSNTYCKALGIEVPSLEAAARNREANWYSLLIVALLERGEPITLEEAARRFEETGIADAGRALASLKRCKPARPPIYRDGDLYALDPHDDEADLWAFRLGLRPPKAAILRIAQPAPRPLPAPDEPLEVAELDEAWRDGIPAQWSAQRVAVAVLDAHGGMMRPDEVIAFAGVRSRWTPLSADSARYWQRDAAIRVRDDGPWELDKSHAAVRSARQAVRDRIGMLRRWAGPDPALIEANRELHESERQVNAERLAAMRRVLIHGFPADKPAAIVLVDVAGREIDTFIDEEIAEARRRLADYDIIAGVDVRGVLRRLDFEPGDRRLGELGPPQKTRQLNRQGRTLKITTALLVQGSCGITRPFGDEKVLHRYLRDGEHRKLRGRLEADARSLFALYQYGCLHGAVRLRWGFLDEGIDAPWVHRDEPTLYDLMRRAYELDVPLEIVAGKAPAWAEPWSRVQRGYVDKDETGWRFRLTDEEGRAIDPMDVQLARLARRV